VLPVRLLSVLMIAPPFGAGALLRRYRDSDALAPMLGLLRATGRFAAVERVRRAGATLADVARGPVATLRIVDHDERPDAAPDLVQRWVDYELTIRCRVSVQDPENYDVLDRLEEVVRAVLERQDYGFCLRRFSQLGPGRMDESRHPEVWNVLRGRFAYIIDRRIGRDVLA
jgi:hypothetical protein